MSTRTLIVALGLLAITACGTDSPAVETTNPCPVTIPDTGFAPPTAPPDGPPDGEAWFGTADLFTSLPLDGAYSPRKSVWWSVRFPGGTVEETPALSVTWTSLESNETHTHEPGTNAFTAEHGWFMIGGIDPDTTGCWLVEASYKGTQVSYTYLLP